jgi:hypothetical protein
MNNLKKKIGKYEFVKYEDFWFANIEFKTEESSFEIFSENLNDELILRILSELNNKILNLDKDGYKKLIDLSKSFWGHDRNNEFTFSGFIIDTTTENLIIDFRMCYHCKGDDNFSDFANWYVDIKDFNIVGCSRQQL